MKTRTSKRATKGLAQSWRSGLEETTGEFLLKRGLPIVFERLVIPYVVPERGAKYTPDFVLPNGIIIETKGQFDSDDRKKHLLVASQWPTLDIRFVFSRASTRISKQSSTTYSLWCDGKNAGKLTFQWANKFIPDEWLREPPNVQSMAALKELSQAGYFPAEALAMLNT